MTYETLLVEIGDGIATVTLNRPEARNALNRTLIRELGDAFNALDGNGAARAIVLRGAGDRAFCAGADLKGMFQEAPILEARDQYAGLAGILEGIPRMRTPVIGQVHGYAVGGGCELAMLADMRIAAAGTKFGFTEVRVGATVTMGGLYNLARIVGLGRAFELLYTTEMIDAEEAYRIGLVNRVVTAEQLAETVRALAEKMSGNFPFEMSLTRNSVYRALDMDFDAAVEEETAAALLSYMGGSRNTGMSRAMDRIAGKSPRAE